ncbi:MAG TPA: TonB-dependent receptor plug domain-containing protein [Chitinophagaceae bacterium]|nr:TonB-dependent receptor plug domain-containing protein [Chitinophagaceae bacterium]
MLTYWVSGQGTRQVGQVRDAASGQPVAGATIRLEPGGWSTSSNDAGTFLLPPDRGDTLVISCIGYGSRRLSLADFHADRGLVELTPSPVYLREVVLGNDQAGPERQVSRLDIATRNLSNSQEALQIIPGVFIGQHQGGGKAEQIFLRGFDCDHGTDIALYADGIPVNMVSHAHGQGYADLHFIIPETVEAIDYRKGPYFADRGDFATAGFADYVTLDQLRQNQVKAEGGMFHTFRGLVLLDLLGRQRAAPQPSSWYVASEYRYSDGYFDHPQGFNRFNLFSKFTTRISRATRMKVSVSGMGSRWHASGQIPDRAVAEGRVGYFGALDPREGGRTFRINLNTEFLTALHPGSYLKNQVYYTSYGFDLHSNFTFFLVDSVNGDEIRQQESRSLLGYRGSYHRAGRLGGWSLISDAGLDARLDLVGNSALSHTRDGYILLNRLTWGAITESSVSPYFTETLRSGPRFTLQAGFRWDGFYHQYRNKWPADSLFSGPGTYTARAATASPKLRFTYQAARNLQVYLAAGRGFHSNDTRVVTARQGRQVLPAAYGTDLGAALKPAPNLLVNVALWYLYLQQEYVYGGDGGTVEFSGRTRRLGWDGSVRYQPLPSWIVDLDINYAHGRSLDDPKGKNQIPLAPVWSSTGGITYTPEKGIRGSLRYRCLGKRPANPDASLQAQGYFITDAVLSYSWRCWETTLTVRNLLNTKWKETQFATLTRLSGEAQPVEDICFTPGTPLSCQLGLTLRF